jgi:hypothetical protein
MAREHHLTPDQVKSVLRRAVELERRRSDEDESASPASAREVEEIAADVGLSEEAVRRALSEVKSGLLPSETVERRTLLDRAIGPEEVVLERTLTNQSVAIVRAAVDELMRAQLFRVQRHHGERVVWEQTRGLWPSVQRAFDLVERVRIPKGVEIETIVAPVGESVRVRFTVRAAPLRRSRTSRALMGVVAGAGIAAVGILATPGHPPIEAISVVAGGGTAAGTWLAARRSYQDQLTRAELTLARFLDELEHGVIVE